MNFFESMRIKLCNRNPVSTVLSVLHFRSTSHLPTSTNIYQHLQQDMPSTTSSAAKAVPRSPPKTRRSTRKRALSSTDTAEPPAKKVATGDGEEDEQKGRKKGKGTR